MSFAMGDKVWLQTIDIQTKRSSWKLDQKKIGLYTITKIINRNAYQLNLPIYLWIWLVFNIDRLEPYIPPLNGQPILDLPDPNIIDSKVEWEIDTIIGAEQYNGIYLYKVHWVGLAHNNDTWELVYYMYHTKEVVKEFYWIYPDAEKPIVDNLREL